MNLKYFLSVSSLGFLGACAFVSTLHGNDWVLVFEDHFSGNSLNTKNWSKIDYVNWQVADWRKYQSQDDSLFVSNGDTLTLWGRYGEYITQNNQTAVESTYACAGIYTMNTFSFQYGKVEVRAKFDSVQGCWPAIWLLPKKSASWPAGGEIDIMEHLNYEGSVYQTIHYADSSGSATDSSVHPDFASYSDVDKNGWHTYAMEWTETAIKFYLDDKLTATFSKNLSTRWPFDDPGNEFYLIIDQQIGGSWVEGAGSGGINQAALENSGAAFEIDWVKVWSDEAYMHIPEPAAFGLFAGLGALVSASSRRRKNHSRSR